MSLRLYAFKSEYEHVYMHIPSGLGNPRASAEMKKKRYTTFANKRKNTGR